ncbi:tripartite tricarboxylate transporter TctB family protein [Pelagibius sp. CAU 1746]|uniref:tripartite tricarboxylate transporter TctB family protein n=1 Tax=Pelagibius sp. CAU 1746 TaxID=3140370 RepID=UPI00325C1935
MSRINRDVVVALLLLLFCGVFLWESAHIRLTDYASMNSRAWPQLVLGVLTLASLVYLWQAVTGRVAAAEQEEEAPVPAEGGILGWCLRYRNALICYALFFGFLITLDYLGMLLGGILFVFLALTLLGRPRLSLVVLHAAVAIGSVGAMWAIFTFGLRVFLPEGELLRIY